MPGFACPACGKSALEIENSLALPPDARSDEILVQSLACRACGFRGVAVYEESRRGSLDSECWEHTGWRLDPLALARLEAALSRCPRPADPRCGCPTHAQLGAGSASGRCAGLESFNPGEPFALRRG